jgi:hypothetical protein
VPSEREIVEIAFSVLVAWTSGVSPVSEEVEILKNALPSMAHRPLDELACQIIHDLSSVAFRESESSPIYPVIAA